MAYTYHGTRNLITAAGRSVQTFPSGLVRVTQTFLGRTANAATHRSTLAVGNNMPGGDSSPCIDGLKIFPEVQERRREDGMTEFIVSAYGRDIGETFVDYIQIDAPINRGNSGGPTFDVYGRVIGVNSAIFSPTGGSVGIGFAVPADVAARVSRQLISNGKVVRGYIGASIQNFDEDMAAAQGIAGQKGAIVAELTPGAPADKAGLTAGDIVLSVNGVRVKSSSELTRQVASAAPGDLLRLQVIRDGKPRTVDIRSGVRPSESQLAAGPGGSGGTGPGPARSAPAAGQAILGMMVSPLDDAARRRTGLPADVRGLIIGGVERNSDAAAKGLQANDVIMRAGDRTLAMPSDLAAVVDQARKAGRPSVLVSVWRGGRTIFLPVKIAD